MFPIPRAVPSESLGNIQEGGMVSRLLAGLSVGGVQTFKDLIAWQLAIELRGKLRPLCKRLLHSKDFRLHEQVRDAARSAPRNIAEGFGRYKHKDFARFVRIGKASEVEILNHLQEAYESNYLTIEELDSLDHAARKAIKAANGLIRYLDSTPDDN
jgi:four helix bundle protein